MSLRPRTIATALALGALAAGGVAIASAANRTQHAEPAPPTLPPAYSVYGQYGVAGKRVFFARLTGAAEVGPNGTPAAGNLYGLGGASVLIKGRLLCSSIVTMEGGFPTAAHIHRGAIGVNGPVVVPLPTPAAGTPISATSSGCAAADPVLLEEIRTKPGRFYVNVHTSDLPNGALRGQLASLANPTAKKKPVKKKPKKRKPVKKKKPKK